MKLSLPNPPKVTWPQWMRNMFNLNDSRWGRGDDSSAPSEKPEGAAPDSDPPKPPAAPQAQPDDYLRAAETKRQLADHQRAEAARREDAGQFKADLAARADEKVLGGASEYDGIKSYITALNLRAEGINTSEGLIEHLAQGLFTRQRCCDSH